jgi:hypothetical protein
MNDLITLGYCYKLLVDYYYGSGNDDTLIDTDNNNAAVMLQSLH